MKNTGNRIKQVRKILNISQEKLAKELGITKQAISNVENSRSCASCELLYMLGNDYNVNLNYIITGKGEIFKSNKNAEKSLKKAILNDVMRLLESRGIK